MDYTDVLREFSNEKIRYAVAGGFAAVAHGVVRVTMDLDLAVSLEEESLGKAWDALMNLGFVPRQSVSREIFSNPKNLLETSRKKDAKAISFYHSKSPFLVVDILFEKEFSFEDSEVTTINLLGVMCPVFTIEKLIELKANAGRPKDLEDIRELKKISKK